MESFVFFAIALIGVNSVLWGVVGLARYAYGRFRPARAATEQPPAVTTDRVAVLIAAHNEELVIAHTIASACAQVSPAHVFVASDGSTDARPPWHGVSARTSSSCGPIAERQEPSSRRSSTSVSSGGSRSCCCSTPTRPSTPTTWRRDCRRSTIPRSSRWLGGRRRAWTRRGRRGSAASCSRTASATTSCCSTCSSTARRHARSTSSRSCPDSRACTAPASSRDIEIDAPGLVIEDFNMTFEVHAKRLGRIAFRPGAAVAHTQDPDTLSDYARQMRRWTLGFWQTVRRHRVRGDRFWGALALYIVEVVVSSVLLVLAVPLFLVSAGAAVWAELAGDPDGPAAMLARAVPPVVLLLGVVVPDLVLSVIAAIITRRIAPLRFAPSSPSCASSTRRCACARSSRPTFARASRAGGGRARRADLGTSRAPVCQPTGIHSGRAVIEASAISSCARRSPGSPPRSRRPRGPRSGAHGSSRPCGGRCG